MAESRSAAPPAAVAEARGAALRAAAALAALLVAPWVCRAVSLAGAHQPVAGGDLRGFAADAAAALLCLGLFWGVARFARWLAVLATALLAAGYYANTETIAALGTVASPLDLAFFADPTFFEGSALAVAHPVVLALVVVASLALAVLGMRRRPWSDALLALAAGGFLTGALQLATVDPRLSTWRQVNALLHNAEWLALREAPEPTGTASPVALLEYLPELGADLQAPPAFAFDGRGRNVLLLVLESVSANYLPSATRAHGREAVNQMPNLDRAFARNLGYATFFAHQRRTNRGLFALLCGELPRLTAGMPKMTVAAVEPWQRCLPEILREHGYRTVFLQSAPLAFMLKDRFMPAIGFDETLGHDWFERAYLRTRWGVDDRAFLEQAVTKLESLRAAGEPWFLTLLTVGSHHPYVVPPDFGPPGQTEFRRVFGYLDNAVGRFLQALQRSGSLDDTLVLITSDESAGDLGQAADATAGVLSQNWGVLVALAPERPKGLVTEPFAQSDVPLSVLDYLGLAESGTHLLGRSVFRRYERPRKLFFGNVNHHMLGGIRRGNSLVQCELEGRRCAQYRVEGGRFFAPSLKRLGPAPRFEEQIREVARRSLPPDRDAPLVLPLLTNPVFEVRKRELQMVQGISQLALEPHEWIEVEIEAEARGEGRVALHHSFELDKNNKPLQTRTRIAAGQSLRLRYAFASDLPVSTARLRTLAQLEEGPGVDLVFRRRSFVLRRAGERPAEGVQIEAYELDPPAVDPQALSAEVVPMPHFADYLRYRQARSLEEPADDAASE